MITLAGGLEVYLAWIIKMPTLIAENKALYPSFVSIYLASTILLLTLLLIHVGAALYHRYVKKDHYNVCKRMTLPA